MSAVALRDLHDAMSRLPMEGPRTGKPAGRVDAELGIRELEALRNVDVVTPTDVAQFAEPLIDLYRGQVTSGDHLRLPVMGKRDNHQMRMSMDRILATDTSARGGSPEQLGKERRMLEVLGALESAIANIQSQATTSKRG